MNSSLRAGAGVAVMGEAFDREQPERPEFLVRIETVFAGQRDGLSGKPGWL